MWGCTLAELVHKRCHVIAWHVEQTLEALRFLIRVHIHSLRVLHQLPLKCLGVGQFHDAGGQGKQFGKLRGTEAPCTRDDLEAVRIRANGDGLNHAVGSEAFGKLAQLALLEGAAGVGGGLVDGVDCEVLELTAVLHGALLRAWLCCCGGVERP